MYGSHVAERAVRGIEASEPGDIGDTEDTPIRTPCADDPRVVLAVSDGSQPLAHQLLARASTSGLDVDEDAPDRLPLAAVTCHGVIVIDVAALVCLGRLRSVSIASIAFEVFPSVFFNSGVLLSLKTEPKRPQNDRVLRQFRDSKKQVLDFRGADALLGVAWARHCRRRKSAARHDVAHLLTTCFFDCPRIPGGPATVTSACPTCAAR